MKFEKQIYELIIKSLPKRKYHPLSEPEINQTDKKNVVDCLNTGWVSSSGVYLDRFKSKLENIVKKKNIIPVINGTSALHLSLVACGVGPGDEVILSPQTFISTGLFFFSFLGLFLLSVFLEKVVHYQKN